MVRVVSPHSRQNATLNALCSLKNIQFDVQPDISLRQLLWGIVAHFLTSSSLIDLGLIACIRLLQIPPEVFCGVQASEILESSRTFFFLAQTLADLEVTLLGMGTVMPKLQMPPRWHEFSPRISWNLIESILPSKHCCFPVPEEGKQPQSISEPPPCLSVGGMFID